MRVSRLLLRSRKSDWKLYSATMTSGTCPLRYAWALRWEATTSAAKPRRR